MTMQSVGKCMIRGHSHDSLVDRLSVSVSRRQVSTPNLERVRRIKNRLVRLTTRVQVSAHLLSLRLKALVLARD